MSREQMAKIFKRLRIRSGLTPGKWAKRWGSRTRRSAPGRQGGGSRIWTPCCLLCDLYQVEDIRTPFPPGNQSPRGRPESGCGPGVPAAGPAWKGTGGPGAGQGTGTMPRGLRRQNCRAGRGCTAGPKGRAGGHGGRLSKAGVTPFGQGGEIDGPGMGSRLAGLKEHAALSFPLSPAGLPRSGGFSSTLTTSTAKPPAVPCCRWLSPTAPTGLPSISTEIMWSFTIPQPHSRIRWTLAHELGHILMGHFASGYSTPGNPPLDQGEKAWEDVMADRFASQLLCPLPGVFLCGPSSQGELAQLCDLSAQAAGITWGRLEEVGKPAALPRESRPFFDGGGAAANPRRGGPGPVAGPGHSFPSLCRAIPAGAGAACAGGLFAPGRAGLWQALGGKEKRPWERFCVPRAF